MQRQYSAGGDTEEWQMQDANSEVRKNTVGDGKDSANWGRSENSA
jgi:hypothetical protein